MVPVVPLVFEIMVHVYQYVRTRVRTKLVHAYVPDQVHVYYGIEYHLVLEYHWYMLTIGRYQLVAWYSMVYVYHTSWYGTRVQYQLATIW